MPPVAAVLAAALALAGCSPCKTASSTVLALDGGPVRCVASEDCPRTGTEILCVTDRPLAETITCLSCIDTACIRTEVSCP
jgi:hypothetical protein